MAIVLDNITVSYRSVPAVHHAYARFEPGSSWAIFGPNGAGKSTLLKAVMRLLPCDTGSVQWQGLQRRDLAYLPQQAEIDRSLPMTVAELTALGLWHELGAFGGICRAQRARVLQALEQVGMAAFAQRQIAALSRGQFQRVLFARMLVQDARFLLLDEPFNAMDAYTTQSLLMLLRQCQQQGKGIIAVVHDAAQPLIGPIPGNPGFEYGTTDTFEVGDQQPFASGIIQLRHRQLQIATGDLYPAFEQ